MSSHALDVITNPVETLVRAQEAPTREEAFKIFNHVAHAEYNGVKGVMCFDSGVEGPCVGITIGTHGNEPAGLAPLWYFMEKSPLLETLKKGKVFFVLNNLQAMTSYWQATTFERKLSTRFVDVNMNRLPADVMRLSDDLRYEVRRAQELAPIWERFDVGVDIHSTSQESPPMMLVCGDGAMTLAAGMPIPTLVSGFSDVMRDSMACDFYGKNGEAQVVFIEAGSHENPRSNQVSVASVKALLHNLGMRDEAVPQTFTCYEHYHVVASVYFPDESYEQTEIFPMFGPIEKGDVVGRGNGEDICAPVTGHTLMSPAVIKPLTLAEEVIFFSEPVKQVEV